MKRLLLVVVIMCSTFAFAQLEYTYLDIYENGHLEDTYYISTYIGTVSYSDYKKTFIIDEGSISEFIDVDYIVIDSVVFEVVNGIAIRVDGGHIMEVRVADRVLTVRFDYKNKTFTVYTKDGELVYRHQ